MNEAKTTDLAGFGQLDALNQVAAFHTTFHHPILDVPQIPAENRCKLRVNLLAEELQELEEAIAQKDLTGIADALCDLQYVLSGAVLEFGLAKKFPALFDEVQRSNMSKACQSLEEAKATVKHYAETKGEKCFIQQEGDVFLVFREADHKTMKSVGYSPADLERILQAE